jgi:hypothetical protein
VYGFKASDFLDSGCAGHAIFKGMWQVTYNLFYTADSVQEIFMTQGTVQLIAGVLCLLLIAVIFLRRKGRKKTEDDF